MATKLQTEPDPTPLYDEDFYAWAQHQAAALRRLQAKSPNVALDFANLIEEIEGLARSDLRTARSQLRRLIEHLLKLENSPADRPRRQWLRSVDDARFELEDVFSRSVRNAVQPLLSQLFADARRSAALDLEQHGEPAAARALPETCPYTLDQLTDKSWYPANRHGLVDDPL